MFLNRKEQITVLVLCGTLCIGALVSYFKNRYPDRVEDFGIARHAARPPAGDQQEQRAPEANVAPPDSTRRQTQIDLNLAAEKDLERLPRIGPALAKRIVDYRREHGPFKKVEDLKGVRGIGSKILEEIRPFLVVGQSRDKR